jgi:hypothetical protein
MRINVIISPRPKMEDFNLRKLFVIILFAIIMFLYCLGHAIQTPANSDYSSIILEANSIYEGNIFLSGWNLSTVSYYTTDIPFYVLGIMIFGFTHRLLYIIPSLIYILTVASVLWIVYDGKMRGSLVALCFIGVPMGVFGGLSLAGPIHIVAIFYCLICVKFLQLAERKKIFYLYFGLLFCWTLIGDTISLWILGIPILLLGIYRIYVNQKQWKREIIPLVIVCVSSVVSNVVLNLINFFGGFKVPGTTIPMFVELKDIGQNVYSTTIGLLNMFYANFFGNPIISMQTIMLLFHFGVMVMIFCILGQLLQKMIKKEEIDYTNQLITTSIFVTIFAYLFSNMNTGTDSGRYLLPVVWFGAVLIGKWFNVIEWNGTKKWIYTACFGLYALSMLSPFSFHRNLTSTDQLQVYLQSQGLTNGYGSYWYSASTTVHSEQKVKVRQVESNNLKIFPYAWLSDKRWYNEPTNFIIFDSTNWWSVNKTTAVNTFGEPMKELKFQDVYILVWDKDISKLLSR